ncbi:MAG: hypothetical protein ACFFAN_15645 [Promethearchaeota archaeon]
MKDLYEIGVLFRGIILVNHHFKDIPNKKKNMEESHKDLRGSFISAIISIVNKTFNNNPLEYLESGNYLFMYKIGEIFSSDNPKNSFEPVIFYGLAKKKKKSEKTVKIFRKKVSPLLELFIERYSGKNLIELEQFRNFEYELLGILL